MKTELPKVKQANPEINHKDAFKVAAGNWFVFGSCLLGSLTWLLLTWALCS
jgi:hypothetical protein